MEIQVIFPEHPKQNVTLALPGKTPETTGRSLADQAEGGTQ